MSSRDLILTQISGFLREFGMSEAQFGLAVGGDHKFMARLRAGSVTLALIERAEDFMRRRRAGEQPQATIRRTRRAAANASAA